MTAPDLALLWRGPLSGCNYACHYCPFAKRKDSRETLRADALALEKFCGWAISRPYTLEILFTPWGEGLIRKCYQQAMIRLSLAPNVASVAIQTNLSAPLGWLKDTDLKSAALWATYHPGEVSRGAFLRKIDALTDMNARFSVGMVALREHFDEIDAMRAALHQSVYLWINAEESIQGQYTEEEVERLSRADPLFSLNNRAYPSLGLACGAGSRALSIDGEGNARSCHFVDERLGNVYDADFESRLRPRACPKQTCNCHIGYSHLDALELRSVFEGGFAERRALPQMRERQTALQRMDAFNRAAAQVSIAGR